MGSRNFRLGNSLPSKHLRIGGQHSCWPLAMITPHPDKAKKFIVLRTGFCTVTIQNHD